MTYSRGTKKYGFMRDDQFQQILATMMAVLNPVKSTATFLITPVHHSIKEVIDYSKETGIKLHQESTQYLPMKFNITGGEVNQFIETLKDQSQKMS